MTYDFRTLVIDIGLQDGHMVIPWFALPLAHEDAQNVGAFVALALSGTVTHRIEGHGW